MKIHNRTLRLISIVVVLAIVSLGIVLGVVPLLAQVAQNDSQTSAQRNAAALIETQIEALQNQSGNVSQLQAQLSQLEKGVPALEQFQDVIQAVSDAASATGVSPATLTRGDEAAYTGVNPSASSIASASANATGSATSGQAGFIQIPITVTVTGTTVDSGVAFVNKLRQSTRLIDISEWSVSSASSSYETTVQALVFLTAAG